MSMLASRAGLRWPAALAAWITIALALAGCSAGGDDVASRNKAACGRAFEDAGPGAGTAGLDATLRRCVHWTDWVQGAESHPGVLAGMAPIEALEVRCADATSGLSEYATCASWARSDETPTPKPRVTIPPIRTLEPIARSERGDRSAPRSVSAAKGRTKRSRDCTPGYSPCIPPASDVDCAGGGGDGPAYTRRGVVYRVTGPDPYDLDRDRDGRACERRR